MKVKTEDTTIRVGLIGAGIQASRMPRLHEQEARAMGISCSYELIDLNQPEVGIEALPRLLHDAQSCGFAGLNITHPCKQAVIPLLDELSAEAAAIGAVNTVVFSQGKRVGHNTDWWGFAESFRRGLPDIATDRVVLLGAGGAGAAIAHAAMLLGINCLAIYDREHSRAQTLAWQLTKRFGAERAVSLTDPAAVITTADGLIHATPAGMTGYPRLPFPMEWLHPAQWVAEIVYFPLETELLRQARLLGCRLLDGSGMAVFQAVRAFQLFTGVSPDCERMLRHFHAMGTS